MAKFNLGLCYLEGKGVQKSAEQAFHYFKLAADQGHASAQLKVGYAYDQGLGISQSDENAVGSYKLVADQNFPGARRASIIANYNLGNCYIQGWC